MANTPDDKDPEDSLPQSQTSSDALRRFAEEETADRPADPVTEAESGPADDETAGEGRDEAGTETDPDLREDDADDTGRTAEEAEIVDEDPEPEPDPAPEPEPEPKPAPKPAPAPVQKRKGGLVAPLIGGVLAAGVGYGAAQYIKPEGWPFPGTQTAGMGAAAEAELAATREKLAALETRLDEMPAPSGEAGPDLTPQLAALQDQLTALSERVTSFDERLTELAKAPVAAASEEAAAAVAAYEREIAAMREELATQRDENAQLAETVASAADKAEAEVDAAMDRAAQVEARAALMRIDAALANGAAFESALGQFGDIAVPDPLAAVAAQGVPTLAELQRDFPAAARAALDVALAEQAEGGVGDRLNAFVRSQLGLRSLEAREGDDADAVLSRAEAALRKGELGDALAELDSLPEGARSEMSGWIDAANARAAAVEAAKTLEQSLNSN